MSKCLKCGAPLPPTGECPRCALGQEAAPTTPSILDRDLQLDRRQRVPSFSEISALIAPSLPNTPNAVVPPPPQGLPPRAAPPPPRPLAAPPPAARAPAPLPQRPPPAAAMAAARPDAQTLPRVPAPVMAPAPAPPPARAAPRPPESLPTAALRGQGPLPSVDRTLVTRTPGPPNWVPPPPTTEHPTPLVQTNIPPAARPTPPPQRPLAQPVSRTAPTPPAFPAMSASPPPQPVARPAPARPAAPAAARPVPVGTRPTPAAVPVAHPVPLGQRPTPSPLPPAPVPPASRAPAPSPAPVPLAARPTPAPPARVRDTPPPAPPAPRAPPPSPATFSARARPFSAEDVEAVDPGAALPGRRPTLDATDPALPAFAPAVPVDTALLAQERVQPAGARELHARPAPWWRRALAGTVDAALIGSVLFGFLLLASKVVGLKGPPSSATGAEALLGRLSVLQAMPVPALALAVLLCLVYGTAFGILGRTPGRMLAGLRLVDGSGLPPAPARAALRSVLSVLSFALFLGGFWLALFDRRRQTLHDKLSATFVVLPL